MNTISSIISKFVADAYISATKNAPYNHSDVCEITHEIISMYPENEEIEIIDQVESALETANLVYIDREWVVDESIRKSKTSV